MHSSLGHSSNLGDFIERHSRLGLLAKRLQYGKEFLGDPNEIFFLSDSSIGVCLFHNRPDSNATMIFSDWIALSYCCSRMRAALSILRGYYKPVSLRSATKRPGQAP